MVFFDLVLFCIVDKLNSLEVTTVFTIDLSVNQLSQTVWIWEKPIVLDDLKLLFFCFFADSDVASLENFGTQACLAEILFEHLTTTTPRSGVLSYHLPYKLWHLKIFLFSTLLGVVYVFKVVQIHRVHFKVNHIHFFLTDLRCFLLQRQRLLLTFTNQRFDVFIVEAVTNLKYCISAVVHHIHHLFLLQALCFRSHATFLNDHIV